MKFKHVNLPINVENYFFETFCVEWDADDGSGKRQPFPEAIDLEAEIQHAAQDKNNDVWIVTLDVTSALAENEDDDALLYFEARVIGIFTSPPMLQGSDLAEGHALIGSSTAEVLCGALRERLAAATATSPYGAYYLPLSHIFFPPKEIKVSKATNKKLAAAEAKEKKEKAGARQTHLKFVKE